AAMPQSAPAVSTTGVRRICGRINASAAAIRSRFTASSMRASPPLSLTLIRELANWQYVFFSGHAGFGERAPTAHPRMAQGPARAFPAANRWRPGQGWRLRHPHRGKARRQPADRERTFEGADAGRAHPREAVEAMDLLSPGRGAHPSCQEGDLGKGLAIGSKQRRG